MLVPQDQEPLSDPRVLMHWGYLKTVHAAQSHMQVSKGLGELDPGSGRGSSIPGFPGIAGTPLELV